MKPSSLLLALFALTAAAHAETYTIVGRHTFPVFEVDHYGFTLQRGRFGKTSGKLELDPAHQEGSVDVTIDAASIDMGFEEWNKHMRGERA
jgi:polyisoprenoid-binding protein YceI